MGLLQSIVARLLPSRQPTADFPAHIERGRQGEERAAKFLKARGWKILRRNFRGRGRGEVDLVCRDGEVLVFVEVKARADESFGRPSAAVDKKKRRLLSRAALEWLRMLDMPDVAFRFDIVEVLGDGEIHHIEGAFSLPKPFHY